MSIKDLISRVNENSDRVLDPICPNCGSVMVPIVFATNPPINSYQCLKCGNSVKDDCIDWGAFLRAAGAETKGADWDKLAEGIQASSTSVTNAVDSLNAFSNNKSTSKTVSDYKKKEFHKLIESISDKYEKVLDENATLQEKLNNFNSEERIKSLKDEISDIRSHSLLVMSDKELKEDRDFRKQHYQSCINGGTFRYTLSGTGIGTDVVIECPKCGEKKNITDVDSW